MLTVYKTHFAILVSQAEPYSVILEEQSSALPLIDPVLEIYNTESLITGYEVEAGITWELDLGTSPDPYASGTWTKVYPSKIIPPRDLYVHKFDLSLTTQAAHPKVRHILNITTEKEEAALLHALLVGKWDIQFIR